MVKMMINGKNSDNDDKKMITTAMMMITIRMTIIRLNQQPKAIVTMIMTRRNAG